jgi:hypothetical protein
MAGSTAGVVKSPWYGGSRTAPPSPSYTTYATTSACTEVFKYYTTKAPEFYTTTYADPSHYTDALNYYSAPSYYTTKATEQDYACCPILLHRGSSWLLQNGWVLHRSGKFLLCPDLHNHNWGGQVLRSPDFLHQSCSFVLRWTKILHWCSSLLHHDLRYT